MRYLLLLTSIAACQPNGSTDLEENEDGLSGVDPGDSADYQDSGDDTGEDSGEIAGGEGTISGVIDVSLFELDALGNPIAKEWAGAYGDTFPFGPIFVAAFQFHDETGEMTFYDQYAILDPVATGNAYQLTVDSRDAESVFVYAALDYWGDTVISKADPDAVYVGEIPIVVGADTPEVDIVIDAPYYDFSAGGGGGGDPGDWVNISGTALIAQEYTGGSCISMLYDSAGEGPYYASVFSPMATETGASGSYSLVVPANWGQGMLVGAWDANQNGLYDPADVWGGYVDESGASANPLGIGASDLPDHTLMIPDGNGFDLGVVPFVRIGGNVTYSSGYDTLPAGSSVHVFVLKYRPQADISVTSAIEDAYDFQSFSGAELTGSTLAFSLLSPANALVYLWAYVDEDGDGVLNEVGTAVGSYSATDGQLATGTSSFANLEVVLGVP